MALLDGAASATAAVSFTYVIVELDAVMEAQPVVCPHKIHGRSNSTVMGSNPGLCIRW